MLRAFKVLIKPGSEAAAAVISAAVTMRVGSAGSIPCERLVALERAVCAAF